MYTSIFKFHVSQTHGTPFNGSGIVSITDEDLDEEDLEEEVEPTTVRAGPVTGNQSAVSAAAGKQTKKGTTKPTNKEPSPTGAVT